jgi:hypothetical protein
MYSLLTVFRYRSHPEANQTDIRENQIYVKTLCRTCQRPAAIHVTTHPPSQELFEDTAGRWWYDPRRLPTSTSLRHSTTAAVQPIRRGFGLTWRRT